MADRPNVEDVFEAWAHVAARIRKRSPEEQQAILAGLGIGPEWPSVHEHWSKLLNEDIQSMRMDRPRRYAQICREEEQRRNRSGGLPPTPAEEAPNAMPATEAAPLLFGSPPAEAPRGPNVTAPAHMPLTGPPPPPRQRYSSAPPPPIPAPPQEVRVGLRGMSQLGGAPAPKIRPRAETLDLKEPPAADAIPFETARTRPARTPATTVDFRDMITPQQIKPDFPWMAQEQTVGVKSGAAASPKVGRRPRRSSAPPPADFRQDLVSPQNQPKLPAPNQDDTASGVDLGATVEAARQVSTVMTWTVERWARLSVALERQPENADAIWNQHGITSREAREHAQRQWQTRLSKEPSVKAEMLGHLDRFRAQS